MAPNNDPLAAELDQDDPFSDPATGGTLDEFLGKIVILMPTGVEKKPSKFPGQGNIDVVKLTIIGVDTDEPGYSVETTSYSGSLNTLIKTKVGHRIVGKLKKTKFDLGMGWDLEAGDRDMKLKALPVYKAWKAAQEKAADPFS